MQRPAIDLPFDLFRNEMTLKPVPGHILRQIVDDIFIPLVTTHDFSASR
jgi:hypothetical protein